MLRISYTPSKVAVISSAKAAFRALSVIMPGVHSSRVKGSAALLASVPRGARAHGALSVILVSALFNTACSGYSPTGGPGPLVQEPLTAEVLHDFDFTGVRDVAVLPIEGEPLRYQPATLATQLQQSLVETIALETDLEVRNLTEVETFTAALSALDASTLADKAAQLNQRLQTDGVFYARLSKYREPARGEHGPGAVSFRVWFLPRTSRLPTWSATYELTEKPLSENLFRMRQALTDGMSYRGAQELLEDGFRESAREFERLRAEGHQ